MDGDCARQSEGGEKRRNGEQLQGLQKMAKPFLLEPQGPNKSEVLCEDGSLIQAILGNFF
jgi:hypothetical protein